MEGPMSVDIPDRVCGTLGCVDEPDVEIDHPDHGHRVVCDDHAGDHPVIEVFDDE